jgi:hypothetical protein
MIPQGTRLVIGCRRKERPGTYHPGKEEARTSLTPR